MAFSCGRGLFLEGLGALLGGVGAALGLLELRAHAAGRGRDHTPAWSKDNPRKMCSSESGI